MSNHCLVNVFTADIRLKNTVKGIKLHTFTKNIIIETYTICLNSSPEKVFLQTQIYKYTDLIIIHFSAVKIPDHPENHQKNNVFVKHWETEKKAMLFLSLLKKIRLEAVIVQNPIK